MTTLENDQVITITQILNDCPVAPLTESFWGKILLKKARLQKERFPLATIEKAGSWTTCACGKLTPNLQRGRAGRPTDSALRQLGMDFYREIKHGRAIQAAEVLVRIEMRSKTVLERKILKRAKS